MQKWMVATSWNMENEGKNLVNEFNIIDNGGRRKNGDRRTFCYTLHIPERRDGADRRSGTDRRKRSRMTDNQ
jgi:hypothetical protein